jgi:hypothetical protein
MDSASHRQDLNVSLVAKIEQCRRLAFQVDDPLTTERLLDLVAEYRLQIIDAPRSDRLPD